ncbi:hypothetical protein K438DRAFT_1786182 [Mycena galopus ATCC 62051]|nr:hypothetical protein K438DRAFT_1786182 [Mycena galopus ATCC 62051]
MENMENMSIYFWRGRWRKIKQLAPQKLDDCGTWWSQELTVRIRDCGGASSGGRRSGGGGGCIVLGGSGGREACPAAANMPLVEKIFLDALWMNQIRRQPRVNKYRTVSVAILIAIMRLNSSSPRGSDKSMLQWGSSETGRQKEVPTQRRPICGFFVFLPWDNEVVNAGENRSKQEDEV